MHYKQQNWLDDPDAVLSEIFDNLSEINGFHFVSISINMSQVYNVSLKQTNYDSMNMFLKGVKFNGIEFFDLTSITKLEKSIRNQLSYIDGLYFQNMEIRCSSRYTDTDLGLHIQEKPVSKHNIIEQIQTSL
jgi:hypothetical protein